MVVNFESDSDYNLQLIQFLADHTLMCKSSEVSQLE